MANHTSPIDVIILASDGCYAMVTVLLCFSCCCFFHAHFQVFFMLILNFKYRLDVQNIENIEKCVCVLGWAGPRWSHGRDSESDG